MLIPFENNKFFSSIFKSELNILEKGQLKRGEAIMDEKSLIFHLDLGEPIGKIYFDGTVCLMVLLTCVLVFLFAFVCTRNLSMKPKGKQNLIEIVVDFVRGIISSNIPKKEINDYHLLGFTLFLFVLFSNAIGLVTKIVVGDDISLWKSPTADPLVTLTLAFTVMLLSTYFSVRKMGLKGYFKNSFLKPVAFLIPIKFMEEFTNTLTLGLRLYGNIFAGEVLLGLIASAATSFGVVSFVIALPLEMVWQGFSIFIGAIQAYIFVTLSMVYISHKIEVEE